MIKIAIIAAIITAALFFTYRQFMTPAEVVTNPIVVGPVLTEAAPAPVASSEPASAPASAAQ